MNANLIFDLYQLSFPNLIIIKLITKHTPVMIFQRLKKNTSIIKIEKEIFYEIFSSIKGCIGGGFKSVCLGGKLKINLDFLPTNQLTSFLHSIFTNYWWRLNNHSIQIKVVFMDMLRNNSNPLKGPLILSINFPVFRFAWGQAECLKDHSTLSLV